MTPYKVVDVAIAVGETTTGAINKQHRLLAGIFIPVAHDGATMTFTACTTEGGTYIAVKDSDGNVVSLAATNAAGAIGISGAEADALAPWPFLRCVSASAEDPARAFQVVLR